jgi:hypothetical protein
MIEAYLSDVHMALLKHVDQVQRIEMLLGLLLIDSLQLWMTILLHP